MTTNISKKINKTNRKGWYAFHTETTIYILTKEEVF